MRRRYNFPTDKPSKRELEILKLVAEGLSNIEIAEKLCISNETARTHIMNLYAKCNLSRENGNSISAMRVRLALIYHGLYKGAEQ